METDMSAVMKEKCVQAAMSDVNSAMYKRLRDALIEVDAQQRLAKLRAPEVVVSFQVSELDIQALERQFGVRVKVRGATARGRLTPRVAAMMALIESALVEHAGAARGRRILNVDGDLSLVIGRGYPELVERTSATARLNVSYFQEEETLQRRARKFDAVIGVRAQNLMAEVANGGGTMFWPRLRLDGPRMEAVIFNHFRTPACLAQVVEVARRRGGPLFGAMPFQVSMFVDDEGDYEGFPGKYVVNRETDTISFIPRSDPTMSISHPFSALMAIASTNSVRVGNTEWLCEKYANIPGVMYYVLREVGREYEAPEVLRTHYFDSSKHGVTEIEYPKAVLTKQGVVVGFERKKTRIWTDRLNKIVYRLSVSHNPVITPPEAFSALCDTNNRVVNTLDSTVVAERLPTEDEMDLCIALACNANRNRRTAKATLGVLLDAVKQRTEARDMSLAGLANLALVASWRSVYETITRTGRSFRDVESEYIPTARAVDACGTDFSVVVRDCDPWVTIDQEVGFRKQAFGVADPSSKSRVFVKCDGVRREREIDATLGWMNWMEKPEGTRTAADVLRDVLRRARSRAASIVIPPSEREQAGSPVLTTLVHRLTTGVLELQAGPWLRTRQFFGAKDQLRRKLYNDFSAHNRALPENTTVVYADHTDYDPVAVSVPDVDPYSAIQSDLVEILGGPPDRDVLATGHRINEVDVDVHVEGNFVLNDFKREIPKRVSRRRPKIDFGVEGTRAPSQMSLFAALKKRNINVPDNRVGVNLDEFPGTVVDRFIAVCYRSDWESVVRKHLESGMFVANEVDIDNFLANADEAKAKKMLDEFFSESTIDLTQWLLMAKGKVKPKRDEFESGTIDHSQTIMYQENSSVNAFYSAMIRRFKECVDECLLPQIHINAQVSDEAQEEWYNSLEPLRSSHAATYSYLTDIKCYDRSQDQVALRCHLEFYRRHGLNEETLEKWTRMHGTKRAVNMMFGVVGYIALGGVSGVFDTLWRNGIVNAMAVVETTGVARGEIVMLDIKGDDMDAEFSRPVKVEQAIDGMAMRFNFSAKFFSANVRYFCKQFRLKLGGRWYQVADPWARAQSYLTPAAVASHGDALAERWESMQSELRHYQNDVVVEAAARAAQQFYGLKAAPIGLARALSLFARDKTAYVNFFGPPEVVY